MDDEICKYYRKEAMESDAKRDRAFQNSQRAYERADWEKAKMESEQGKLYGRKRDEANRRAANAIFIQMNENRPLSEIDLHGLFVKEAIELLEDRVIYALNNRMQKLDVIIGQGHHSKSGAKLKPIVMQFAMENCIRYTIYEHNPGCFLFHFGQFADVENERVAPKDRRSGRINVGQTISTTSRFIEESQHPSQQPDWSGLWIIVVLFFFFLLLKLFATG